MDLPSSHARSELILGGQKSGKSGRAETLARDWLAASAQRDAVLIATGQAHDEEMAERIARHRRERALRVPGMATVEEPLRLASCIDGLASPTTLLVVDCLTLWVVNWLMPAVARDEAGPVAAFEAQADALIAALGRCAGPAVLVSNEIGLGVIPMGRDVRAYVDTLGTLNQRLARACERVTLMTAGLPLCLKGQA
ncbi:MAG TPA: bifunctional adenosylcobinamide kinase/adenosylcobinamide-phosphate guanylyltransferase [Bordetella sp.]|uniref:bifunctional adenosylcobinamide kinase/adenosylcobinamide-phosphate guanylyltransferase n=1 Tax=Bordetella sp. TaxID=28081 RepID=UPI002ED11F01